MTDKNGVKFVELLIIVFFVGFIVLAILPMHCITEGTQILTPTGVTLMEEIAVGDLVLSQSPYGSLVTGRVEWVKQYQSKRYLSILLADGSSLSCTRKHPIKTVEGWVDAGRIKAGDNVITHQGDIAVKSVARVRHKIRTYDISVVPYNNFYANGFLVHNKEIDRPRYTEGVTALGAMQTKIKVAQLLNGRLPIPNTPPGVMSNLVRMVSSTNSSPYFHATEFRPLTAVEADALAQTYTNHLYKGKSQVQVEMEIGYDEYQGKYFKNENYQCRLIKQVDTTSNYAYAVTVVGDTNTRSRVGGCYAVWVRNWESANAGNTKFIIATYGDEAADDSQTYRFLADVTIAAEADAPGAIRMPAWDAEDDEIRSVSVGQNGGNWQFWR